MLKEIQEEILESLWVSTEKGNFSIDEIKKNCAKQVHSDDLNYLIAENFIIKNDNSYLFTPKGKDTAEKIIRRHRLAEVLLSSILKVVNSKMEEIACQVEHTLLPEVEEAICILLGHPDTAPDGSKIPPGKCCKTQANTVKNVVINLATLLPGESGKIAYIRPDYHSELHQLLSFGLTPGVNIHVHRNAPSFCIKFDNTELALDKEIAKNIFVVKSNN